MQDFNRNSLTIAETRDYLCAEHAARMFVAECWWAIVPSGDKNPLSFANTGDASPFWALVDATLSMGQPLGFMKVADHLGRLTNKPHTDPETLLRQLIKPQVPNGKPDRNLINARAKYAGYDPEAFYNAKMAEYNSLIQADEARIKQVISTIMAQRYVVAEESQPWDDLDDEFFQRVKIGGEWYIPIDRIIDFGEKQLKFMATNDKVPDMIFGSEAAIWEGEINALKHIIQDTEHEGEGNGSKAMDDALASSEMMSAGLASGK